MKSTIRLSFFTIAAISLMQFCSCAAARHESRIVAASKLPGDIAINKYAGRGGSLVVQLHLENGDTFPCVVDTGAPGSVLPKSLEGQLGKRLAKSRVLTFDGDIEEEEIYATPTIYLGDTPLMTGDQIGTWNTTFGILGMDCLRHYCVQLDFQAGKIRFLDPDSVNVAELGKAFPLTGSHYIYIHHHGFFDREDSEWMIDTGFPLDGVVNSKLCKRAVLEQKAQPAPMKIVGVPKSPVPRFLTFSTCSWAGQTYTNLIIQAGHPNLIGLKFLARHQVTFNFPKKMMYLKYTGADALPGKKSASSAGFANP